VLLNALQGFLSVERATGSSHAFARRQPMAGLLAGQAPHQLPLIFAG